MAHTFPLLDFILHVDKYLVAFTNEYGALTYLLLFAIIFLETGIVFTPFLPGDSLLFAAGAIASLNTFNIWWLLVILSLASILGDTANYWIGHFFGNKISNMRDRWFFKKEYLTKTMYFYEKHGGKTIILARFIPIVRTFAPFVAGIAVMPYRKFLVFNILGGILWVFLFTFGGYLFGNIPAVQENFSLVIIAIVIISFIPVLWELIRRIRKR